MWKTFMVCEKRPPFPKLEGGDIGHSKGYCFQDLGEVLGNQSQITIVKLKDNAAGAYQA